jgi:hypothetical protein
MYYDDGFEQETKVKKSELPANTYRAYKLHNGDVISVNDLLLEFKDGILYQVKKVTYGCYVIYERTGRKFTPEQLNEMLK